MVLVSLRIVVRLSCNWTGWNGDAHWCTAEANGTAQLEMADPRGSYGRIHDVKADGWFVSGRGGHYCPEHAEIAQVSEGTRR